MVLGCDLGCSIDVDAQAARYILVALEVAAGERRGRQNLAPHAGAVVMMDEGPFSRALNRASAVCSTTRSGGRRGAVCLAKYEPGLRLCGRRSAAGSAANRVQLLRLQVQLQFQPFLKHRLDTLTIRAARDEPAWFAGYAVAVGGNSLLPPVVPALRQPRGFEH
ncbi:hypothetical protein ON010_g9605 [Phytophthora cinnamomi]|nr:hypothetical protein ON010_g9605 [Phytophthora cinnamomi]